MLQATAFLVVCCQVHAYTACPNNQTAYLAELKSGKEVLVVDGEGQQRSAIIGRVKIETRPLVSLPAAPCLVSVMPTCLLKECTQKYKSCTCSVEMCMRQGDFYTCIFCNLVVHLHMLPLLQCSMSLWQQAENASFCANRYLWKQRLKMVSDTA